MSDKQNQLDNKVHLIVASVRLEVQHYKGRDDRPTLIFLHEGLGCIEMWRDFPQKLSEKTGCNALVYSRQGYGSSDSCIVPRPLSYMHIEALEVLPELLKVANVKDYVLVGHSDGGSIAIINAGGKPTEGLKAIVTMAPHVFCEELSINSISIAKKMFADGDLRNRLKKYHHGNVDCAFWGWNKAWLDPKFAQWNIEKYLPDIRVPQKVIQGLEDPYGTVAQVESIVDKSGTQVDVSLLENCQHAPYKEQEAFCLEEIKEFLLLNGGFPQ